MIPRHIDIPAGVFSANSNDDAAARKRQELRRKLASGERLVVTPTGQIDNQNPNPNQPAIDVPKGKLA